MADATPHLGLPYIAASQAQKHVTHNEALHRLDTVVQIAAKSRHLTAPPAAPQEGDRYIPASGATGAWAAADLNIMSFEDGAWVKYVPSNGWLVWVEDEAQLVVKSGATWLNVMNGASAVVATSAHGAQMQFVVAEELLSGLSGATRDSTITIPNGAIVFNVSERVITAITGATSFSVGIAGEAGKFGSSLGIGAGGSNVGTIGPTGFYSPTPIRLTSSGGNFTGGAVRIAIHYYLPNPPTS